MRWKFDGAIQAVRPVSYTHLDVYKRQIVGVSGSNSEAATRPAVTVIFPNFNHEKYLPQRLQSVLDQTVPPNEIIFLDDCSSDNSVEVARAILSRSNIPYRIVENTSNSGSVFRQWMKGLALARNELIWMAETDDSADRRFLSNILPAFSREDVMAVFGRITCIDQDGALRNDLDKMCIRDRPRSCRTQQGIRTIRVYFKLLQSARGRNCADFPGDRPRGGYRYRRAHQSASRTRR